MLKFWTHLAIRYFLSKNKQKVPVQQSTQNLDFDMLLNLGNPVRLAAPPFCLILSFDCIIYLKLVLVQLDKARELIWGVKQNKSK